MWWKNSVVYQIYPRSFCDSNQDGIGDIQGIISKLDYLQYLGVDVLWLCPVYPTPNKDNGYDVSDYLGINPEFGTMDDMKELIDVARQKGMAIMMDIVANHTSSEHHWFKEARKSKQNSYHAYYIFRDNEGSLPSDLQSIFLDSAWEYNEATDEYYLHLFDKDQPDLNWHHRPVRKDIYAILKYWIDLGIKGFRFDVIDLIAKDIDHQIIGDGPMLHTYIQEMAAEVLTPADLMTVGETWGATPEKAKRYSNPDQSEFSMIFNFQHSLLDQEEGQEKWDLKTLDLLDLKKVFNEQQTELYGQGWNSLFWNNHDLPRIVSRWGSDDKYRAESAKMLGTLLHLMQGTPYIYQGEEIGMTNMRFESYDDLRDIESLNMIQNRLKRGFSKASIDRSLAVKGRDNARTPMQWSHRQGAGFTKATPWIKINKNYQEINVQSQIGDKDSVLEYYRQLIQLRRSGAYTTLIEKGRFEMVYKESRNIFAYRRVYLDQTLLVLCNFYGTPIDLPEAVADGLVVISNYPDQQKPTMALRPYEAIVLDISNRS